MENFGGVFIIFYLCNIMEITDEQFDQMWERAKARDKREEEEWNSLSPDERKRRRVMFSDGFAERVSDDPTGGDDETSESDEED